MLAICTSVRGYFGGFLEVSSDIKNMLRFSTIKGHLEILSFLGRALCFPPLGCIPDALIAKTTLSVNRQNISRRDQNKILNIMDPLKITYFCFKNEPILARVKTIDQNEVECSNP